ncbi:hypothetical protein J6590_065462 [Homalodisca vitripennis]|nr:hypothetical protein J6590_065462 [Homalodisca vitripennis]
MATALEESTRFLETRKLWCRAYTPNLWIKFYDVCLDPHIDSDKTSFLPGLSPVRGLMTALDAAILKIDNSPKTY